MTVCSNYTNRRTVSERGGTAGCNTSPLTVTVADFASQTSQASQSWFPSALPSSSVLGRRWSSWQYTEGRTSSCCYTPKWPYVLTLPHQTCFSILYSWQSRNKNKGNHIPVPNVCFVLGIRGEGRRGTTEVGVVGWRERTTFFRKLLVGQWEALSSPLPWNVEPPLHHVMWPICCPQSWALVIIPEWRLRTWIPCVGAGAGRENLPLGPRVSISWEFPFELGSSWATKDSP